MRRIASLQITRYRSHRLAVKLDDRAKSSLCYGFALYFLHSRKPNLFMAYRRTLARFFAGGEEATRRQSMPPSEEHPTFLQFKWFVTKIFGDPATVAVMHQLRTKCVLMVGGFSLN